MPDFDYMPVHADRFQSHGTTDQEAIPMEHLVAALNDHSNGPSPHDDDLTIVSTVNDPEFERESSRQTSMALVETSRDPRKPIPKSILSIFRCWWREVVAMLISIAALVAICGILVSYQNQPLSAWRFQYLPNSIVSQLMTISRSALMFSTASTISQALWNHVRQEPRALIQVQSFDDASRGPFGAALMLAYATRYCFPGILGSFITVATLLMESFTQQVLQYPLRSDPAGTNSTFPVTHHFVYSDGQDIYAPEAVNSSIQAQVISSLSGNPPSDAFICPSSCCSWEPVLTLGICSFCEDVSSRTKSDCTGNMTEYLCDYTTPGGFSLQRYSLDMLKYTSINTTARYRQHDRFSPKVADPILISFASLVWHGDVYIRPASITECTLSWCGKMYKNATARNGKFLADVEEYALRYSRSYNEGSSRIPRIWHVLETQDRNLTKGSNSTFAIRDTNWQSFAAFIYTALMTGTSVGYGQAVVLPDSYGAFNIGNLMLNNPTISDMGESLAKGLTNIVRNMSTTYTEQFPGVSHVQIQYIQVRWQWLIFPASIVFLGLFLLVFTIVQSHLSGTEIWKISALALLFHPLQGWRDEDLDKDSRSEMMRSAKSMRGQLVYTEHAGYRIVRRSVLSNKSMDV